MAKIVIWGVSTLSTQEQILKLRGLQRKYASLSIQIDNDRDRSVLADCLVLIDHDQDLQGDQDLPSLQWTVVCSGTITEPAIDEIEKVAEVPPRQLLDNLEHFLSSTESKKNIEKRDIETLFSIDPELEGLLQPFASVSPFETTGKQRKALEDAKAKLTAYVEAYLRNQGKP